MDTIAISGAAGSSVAHSFSAQLEERPEHWASPLSPSDLAKARELWRAAAKAKTITSASMAAWMILRGKDPKKAFTPVSNPVKLANGFTPWGSFEAALFSSGKLERAALHPWEDLLSAAGCSASGPHTFAKWSGDHPILRALASFEKASR